MDLKFGALLIISAQICTTLACVCTRNYQPICGSDGQTYNNPCLMACAAETSGSSITVASYGRCSNESPQTDGCVCTLNYSPVCGSDGQSYPNECALKCHQLRFNPSLKVKHTGVCKQVQVPACICTAIEDPVCGSDGNTYGNDCMLNCATVQDSRLRIEHMGACDDGVKVADI